MIRKFIGKLFWQMFHNINTNRVNLVSESWIELLECQKGDGVDSTWLRTWLQLPTSFLPRCRSVSLSGEGKAAPSGSKTPERARERARERG